MAMQNSGIRYDGLVSQTPAFMHVRFDADVANALRCRSAVRCVDGVIYPWDFLVEPRPEDFYGNEQDIVPMTKRQLLEKLNEQIATQLAVTTLEET
jgi:hypothetical protein